MNLAIFVCLPTLLAFGVLAVEMLGISMIPVKYVLDVIILFCYFFDLEVFAFLGLTSCGSTTSISFGCFLSNSSDTLTPYFLARNLLDLAIVSNVLLSPSKVNRPIL